MRAGAWGEAGLSGGTTAPRAHRSADISQLVLACGRGSVLGRVRGSVRGSVVPSESRGAALALPGAVRGRNRTAPPPPSAAAV